MNIIEAFAIISSGLFAGTALTLAWDRLPVWKQLPFEVFKVDFKRSVLVADVLQPLLLLVAMFSMLTLGMQSTGIGQTLAFIAVVGYAIILIVSLAVLVPLQRRLFTLDNTALKLRWLKGHLGRTVLSVVTFCITAVAITYL